MHAIENYSTSFWKALQIQQIKSKAIVANQANQTVYQPMSIVVIEHYYPNGKDWLKMNWLSNSLHSAWSQICNEQVVHFGIGL
jgi:hypothetical protein